MGVQAWNPLRHKRFFVNKGKELFNLSAYYVGASEMAPHRGREGAEIVFAPGRSKNDFGARRNEGEGVCSV